MTVTIDVQPNAARIAGLDPLALNDLLMDAPEPPPPGFGALRPVSSNLIYLFERLPGAFFDDPGGLLMQARAHRFIERLHREEPGDYEKSWPFKVTPLPYQLKVFTVARKLQHFALAPTAPGTGKSKMVIDIAADKYMRDEIDCVAVICSPRGVTRQWINRALPEHMTDRVRWAGDFWRSTKRHYDVMYENKRVLRWMTFPIEAFSGTTGAAADALVAFMKSGRCLLVEDESSRIKDPTTKRTKALIGSWCRGKHVPGLAEQATCRAILTGTPITKGIEDLWAQYEFVDPLILGMSNYKAFEARYCVLVPAFWRAPAWQTKVSGYRNTEEFIRKIAPVTFVVPKDVLGLPPKSYEVIPVELTKEQRAAYKALHKATVEDLAALGIANPKAAVVKLTRLQQLLCGHLYAPGETLEEPPILKSIPSNRIATLTQYIEDNACDRPTLIWSRFTADILEIEQALLKMGRKPVTYYGGTDDDARDAAVEAIRRGAATDFVANPACAGMGIDGLQETVELAIYYTNSFNREHRWQSEDRIHRLGMCGTALYADMVVSGTVDELPLAAFKTTADLIQTLMDRPEMIPYLNED